MRLPLARTFLGGIGGFAVGFVLTAGLLLAGKLALPFGGGYYKELVGMLFYGLLVGLFVGGAVFGVSVLSKRPRPESWL